MIGEIKKERKDMSERLAKWLTITLAAAFLAVCIFAFYVALEMSRPILD